LVGGGAELTRARSGCPARLSCQPAERSLRIPTEVAGAQRRGIRVMVRDGSFDRERERLFGESPIGVTIEVRSGEGAGEPRIAVAAKGPQRLDHEPGVAVSAFDG
jgi:hypothetical protein